MHREQGTRWRRQRWIPWQSFMSLSDFTGSTDALKSIGGALGSTSELPNGTELTGALVKDGESLGWQMPAYDISFLDPIDFYCHVAHAANVGSIGDTATFTVSARLLVPRQDLLASGTWEEPTEFAPYHLIPTLNNPYIDAAAGPKVVNPAANAIQLCVGPMTFAPVEAMETVKNSRIMPMLQCLVTAALDVDETGGFADDELVIYGVMMDYTAIDRGHLYRANS